MSNSLWPHGLQHARLPCPSPSPRACTSLSPSSWWCHPTISSSVVPFSSYLQSFPASGSFQMTQFFTSGGQSIGASASVLPMSIQDRFPLGWTGLISLQSKGLSIFSSTTVFVLERQKPFVGKVMSLLYNMLSGLVIAFLLRSKCLLISWLEKPFAMIFEPIKKSQPLFPLFPHLFAMKWWDQTP